MKKTLQDQYLLIKEGKGHKGVFLTEAKRQFPNLIPINADVELTAKILKDKNVINENIVGLQAINQMIPTQKQPYEIAYANFLKEAKKKEETDKAEAKTVSKSVEKKQEHAHDNTDEKNIDNVIFDQVMMGYYAEMKDPKNADKTMEELKEIVLKNLSKDPIHYTKEGQFGIKGLGYSDEHPGLGKTKEVKGKYASSGMEPVKLNESKVGRNYPNRITGEYEGKPTVFSGDELYDLLQSGLNASPTVESFIKYITYGVTDETSSLSTEDQEKLKTWYNKNKQTKNMPTNESKLRNIIRSIIAEEMSKTPLNENIHKRLKEIDGEVANEVTQSKLNKVQEEIEKRQAQLNMIDENEDLKDLTDGKKIKALQKEIKLLERAKAKLEKSIKGKKKEVLDETANVDEASPEYMAAKQDAESRYNEGEDIDKITADYPQFKRELYNDIIGGFEGMDY